MNERMFRWPTARGHFRLMIMAALLSALAGCGVVGKPGPKPAETAVTPAAEMPAVPAGPVVSQLADGRRGFSIREAPVLDAGSRHDFERAVALMNDRDYAGAVELLEVVIGKAPGVSAPHVDVAIAYRQLDQPEKAEQHLKTALELVPAHPVASNEYGLLLRKAGRFAEARTIYEKAIATFPDYYPARRNLGILCELYLNDQVCALEQYEMYSVAVPGDEQVGMWIADLRARLGKL